MIQEQNQFPITNGFEAIRWFFATMVIVYHFCCIIDIPFPFFIRGTDILQSFFIISGFLTYRSFTLRPSLRNYFEKRAKRIIPPYVITIIFCTFLGAIFTSMSVREYFSSIHFFRYLSSNLLFLNFIEPTLPGVFTSNPLPSVNGSLWTTKVEILFYLLLPLVVWLMRRSKAIAVLIGLYIFSALYDFAFLSLYKQTGAEIYELLRRQIGGQFMFFFAGMSVWHLYESIMSRWRSILVVATAIVAISFFTQFVRYIQPVAYALVIIIISCKFRSLRYFNRLPNITYELFLIHFPIIQAIMAIGIVSQIGTTYSALLLIIILIPLALMLHRITTRG